jgi:lipase chaperone LimK
MSRATRFALFSGIALFGLGVAALRARAPGEAREKREDALAEGTAANPIPVERPAHDATPHDEASGPSAPAPLAATPPSAAAPSLRGTSVDGALEADASGHFVPSASAVRLFDYFLSAEGEVPTRDLRASVRREAERTLPPSEVDSALALFDRYVTYRQVAAARLSGVAPGKPSDALAAMHQVREEAFGEEDAHRMFGESETIAAVTMREAEIETSDLSAEERARRMAEEEESLPPWLRAIHARRADDANALAAVLAGEPK